MKIKKSVAIFLLTLFLTVLLAMPASAASQWETKADMLSEHGYGASATLDGKIYAIGGRKGGLTPVVSDIVKTVEVYDSVTNTWSVKADYPISVVGVQAAVVNGKIYTFGGTTTPDVGTPVKDVYEYDPVANTWTKKADMLTARYATGVVVLDNKIYVIGGGISGSQVKTKAVEMYDPVTNTWTSKASLSYERAGVATFTYQGDIYALGGLGNNTKIERYDPDTNVWTNVSNTTNVGNFVYAFYLNNEIYMFNSESAVIKSYNPTSNIFEDRMTLPAARSTAFYGVVDNKIYFAGNTAIHTRTTIANGLPTAPQNLNAVGQDSSVVLNWSTIAVASSYNIQRSLTPGGPYEKIASVSGTTYTDYDVENGTKYYYIVTAANLVGESGPSNEASATPQADTLTRALLTIYIDGGQIKEYDLSEAELDAFMTWYDAKDAGTGPAKYAFTRTWNKGPFKSRTEYVIFDKILTFDVDQYDVI